MVLVASAYRGGCGIGMIVAIAFIVFTGFAVQATAGFGAGLLAMSLGTFLIPIAEMMQIVVSMSMMLSGYILVRHLRHVDFRLLLRVVLPIMGAGVVGGLLLEPHASPSALRLLLGVVVSAAAARGLYTLFTGKVVVAKRGGKSAYLWVGGAGVVHALIVSGGPLLVYAIEAMGLGKHRFRASLAVVWFVFNSVLFVKFMVTGALGGPELARIAGLVPVVVVATVVGEALHSRVSERAFRAVVFSLLAVAGVLLWLPMLLR